jgi:diacylglycerol kinase (ATP)
MANRNQDGGEIRRLAAATRYSWRGLRAAWSREAAFRQEALLCVVMLPGAFWVGTTAVQRILLIATCLVVLVTELLNSAVEAAIDRIGMDQHELSGHAKDLGSAAVFISLLICATTWLLIAWDRWGNSLG